MLIIIATACVAAGVGAGIFISKRKFDNNLTDAGNKSTSSMGDNDSLTHEINRYEQLKLNLVEVRKNIDNLDIPTPDPLSDLDDTDSSLNKLNKFFEEHSTSVAGTEAFILSILPISQTGEALYSLNYLIPNFNSAFSESIAALKENITIPGIDDIHVCLGKFCDGMMHVNHQALCKALEHHDYMGALLMPIKSGFVEMTGIHDATTSLTESFHGMGQALSCTDINISTDITDFDVCGHIPIMTIAISYFREFSLLIDDKTDAITSLKNIGLDAVGAGGGSLIGAKAGALAGSILGPVGMFVGGIVGGIGGAIGGRSYTNSIKQRPLKRAIEEYQSNASRMKREMKNRSRDMLQSINTFTAEKRVSFKEDKMLKNIPVIERDDVVTDIAIIIYHAVKEHIASMKIKVNKLKSSFWYSESKYGVIVEEYSKRITKLEEQLLPVENIERNPQLALESLLALKIPTQKKDPIYKKKFMECSKELQNMNNKNNSSILVWSYMVNGLYQKTMNEIADFANNQMNTFNEFVDQWKQYLSSLEEKVKVEKGKLGIK